MKPAAIRRELANLRRTAQDDGALPPARPPADDAAELARELAGAFGRVVGDYRAFFELSPAEARARAGTQRAPLGVQQALREGGPAELPRVSVAEALDQAEARVERCHRLYLRTLGALQDLRRRPPIVVRRAGQVNIAGQQVNLTR